MPLTLTITEEILPKSSEKHAIAELTSAMLKWHGLSGNEVMTPNITATVHVLPTGSTFSGGNEFKTYKRGISKKQQILFIGCQVINNPKTIFILMSFIPLMVLGTLMVGQ